MLRDLSCVPRSRLLGRRRGCVVGALSPRSMAGWRILGLCTALALPVRSSSGLLSHRQECKRKEQPDWSGFQTAIEPSGLAGEGGISNLAADLRTDALSLPVPHTYAIVGGGEWGPRVVAKAFLESVYVDWVDDVYLLDMKEAKEYMLPADNGFDEAQAWFNEHLCKAIERCPMKAVVVLDNLHLLEGEEIRLLDSMLSLTDGAKSNMDCDDHKVSAERCLFLMLLNEDGLEENKRKSGKERLMDIWEYKGPAFTVAAFVGRIDAAVGLSQKPRLLPAGMEDAWKQAGILPSGGWEEKLSKRVRQVWEGADRGTLPAVGVAAAAVMLGVAAAYFQLSCSPEDKPDGVQVTGGGPGGESPTSPTVVGGGGEEGVRRNAETASNGPGGSVGDRTNDNPVTNAVTGGGQDGRIPTSPTVVGGDGEEGVGRNVERKDASKSPEGKKNKKKGVATTGTHGGGHKYNTRSSVQAADNEDGAS